MVPEKMVVDRNILFIPEFEENIWKSFRHTQILPLWDLLNLKVCKADLYSTVKTVLINETLRQKGGIEEKSYRITLLNRGKSEKQRSQSQQDLKWKVKNPILFLSVWKSCLMHYRQWGPLFRKCSTLHLCMFVSLLGFKCLYFSCYLYVSSVLLT